MPKILGNPDMQVAAIPGLSGYKFSAVRTTRLGASDYTLVTIACDVSGSVGGFRDLLVSTIKMAVAGCRRSARAGNIMVRVITFSGAVTEVHGFKPLAEIDDSVYDGIRTGGNTALHDAAASAIGAMTEYGRVLAKQDFGVNGAIYIVTDGEDNASTYAPSMVRSKADEAVRGEILESFYSVLIGVNAGDARVSGYLRIFQQDAGLTAYKDAGEATPGNMARMGGFISQSVSSTANALGGGAAAVLTI